MKLITQVVTYHDLLIYQCHDKWFFDMVCHGSQAVSICADKHILLLKNSLGKLKVAFNETCAL